MEKSKVKEIVKIIATAVVSVLSTIFGFNFM